MGEEGEETGHAGSIVLPTTTPISPGGDESGHGAIGRWGCSQTGLVSGDEPSMYEYACIRGNI